MFGGIGDGIGGIVRRVRRLRLLTGSVATPRPGCGRWPGEPAHHRAGGERAPRGLLPRPLRAGQELDHDRQGDRDRPPGAAGRHAPPRPVAVARPLRLRRRRRPGRRALQRRRPGRAGRPLDGRQDRDGARPAAPRAGRAAVRRRRVAGGLRSRAASSPATSRRCRRSTSPRSSAAARRTRRWSRRCPTRRCAASCCRTCAAHDDGWAWQPNLDRPRPRHRPSSAAGPSEALAGDAPYDGPTLWVGRPGLGLRRATSTPRAMDRWFPRNRRVTIKGAGPLGALRAAGGVHRGAAAVPAPEPAGPQSLAWRAR